MVKFSTPIRYLVALLSVGIAFGVSLLAHPIVEQIPTLLFIGAVAVTAWLAGLGPALLATVLAAISIDIFFLSPPFTLSNAPADLLRVALFALVGALISGLSESRRRNVVAEQRQRELLRVTLASIGDAVI